MQTHDVGCPGRPVPPSPTAGRGRSSTWSASDGFGAAPRAAMLGAHRAMLPRAAPPRARVLSAARRTPALPCNGWPPGASLSRCRAWSFFDVECKRWNWSGATNVDARCAPRDAAARRTAACARAQRCQARTCTAVQRSRVRLNAPSLRSALRSAPRYVARYVARLRPARLVTCARYVRTRCSAATFACVRCRRHRCSRARCAECSVRAPRRCALCGSRSSRAASLRATLRES